MKEIIKLIKKLEEYRLKEIPVLSSRHDSNTLLDRTKNKYIEAVRLIQKGIINTEAELMAFFDIQKGSALFEKIKKDFESHLKNSLIFMADKEAKERQKMHDNMIGELSNVFFSRNRQIYSIYSEQMKTIGHNAHTWGHPDITTQAFTSLDYIFSSVFVSKKEFHKYLQLTEEATAQWKKDDEVEAIFEAVFIEVKTTQRVQRGLLKRIKTAIEDINNIRKNYQSIQINIYYYHLQYLYWSHTGDKETLLTLSEEAITYFRGLKHPATEYIMRYSYIKSLVLMETGETEAAEKIISDCLSKQNNKSDDYAMLLLMYSLVLIANKKYPEAIKRILGFLNTKALGKHKNDVRQKWMILTRWLLVMSHLQIIQLTASQIKKAKQFITLMNKIWLDDHTPSIASHLVSAVERITGIQSGDQHRDLYLLKGLLGDLPQKDRKKNRHFLFAEILGSHGIAGTGKAYLKQLKKIPVDYISPSLEIEYVPYQVIGEALTTTR